MEEIKSKIVCPDWEELTLKYYFVYDNTTAIVAWVESPTVVEGVPHDDVIDMDVKIRLQNCSNNGNESFRSYYITRAQYERDFKDKTTIYHQDDYWIYDGELKEKTEDDKKQWWEK